jgi:hypothetical protein
MEIHKYSGIELNQNPTPEASTVPTTWTQWGLTLPSNFRRGETIPDVTGMQLCMTVANADEFQASLRLIVDDVVVGEATCIGAHTEGQYIWVDVYFPTPIKVEEDWLQRDWNFAVQAAYPLHGSGSPFQPNYRLLASTADSGEDFLGNKYRSFVRRNDILRLGPENSFWLSKPNPSKYAVECLYFDMRAFNDEPSVIDRIMLDPITPGVYFHLYYSNDGDPGTTTEEWERKLWRPVAKTFKAERRQEHALPEPIAAKYVCLEFSHLQGQHYSPGTFHQPTVYKKHPKWVLDYFLAQGERVTDDHYVARNVNVVYNAFDIAYNYYVDDLLQDPTNPEKLQPSQSNLTTFLTDRNDVSDLVEPETLQSIRLALSPYQSAPGSLAKGAEYLLGLYSEETPSINYPVERLDRQVADITQVSTLNRDALLVEAHYPAMFFYLTSRHKYRELRSSFRDDRAYFVGIRELAFTRERYSVASDSEMYVEIVGDYANVFRNDFIIEGYPPKKLGV